MNSRRAAEPCAVLLNTTFLASKPPSYAIPLAMGWQPAQAMDAALRDTVEEEGGGPPIEASCTPHLLEALAQLLVDGLQLLAVPAPGRIHLWGRSGRGRGLGGGGRRTALAAAQSTQLRCWWAAACCA